MDEQTFICNELASVVKVGVGEDSTQLFIFTITCNCLCWCFYSPAVCSDRTHNENGFDLETMKQAVQYLSINRSSIRMLLAVAHPIP